MDEGWYNKEEGGRKGEALECGRGRHDLWRERKRG